MNLRGGDTVHYSTQHSWHGWTQTLEAAGTWRTWQNLGASFGLQTWERLGQLFLVKEVLGDTRYLV